LKARYISVALYIVIGFIIFLPLSYAQVQPVPTTDPATLGGNSSNSSLSTNLNTSGQYIYADRLGITFISSVEAVSDAARYQRALSLGAGWTRYPLYWHQAETSSGVFDWSKFDRAIQLDIANNLRINAILLDRPSFYVDGASIARLYEPVFTDCTDEPGAGKQINPNNPWANYVYQVVQRYKPNGRAAQRFGWTTDQGIRYWEMWNEPDFEAFWQGSTAEYARLLKVGYLATKHADPSAQVLIGGILFAQSSTYLQEVLFFFNNDPLARANNYYMDIVAIHSYSNPRRTGSLVRIIEDILNSYNVTKPIWVNESGVGVWNDYPGPRWATRAFDRQRLATADQAAWFFVQSTAYAWVRGADVVFFHQLYDDCGDRGGNFPYDSNEWGDAFGLFRNRTTSPCYSQHISPDTPRPAASAFRMMADVFGRIPFEEQGVFRQDGITTITFTRPSTDEQIQVIWNDHFSSQEFTVTATGNNAELFTLSGRQTLVALNEEYTLTLEPAQPDNILDLPPNEISAIGGSPVILIQPIGDTQSSVTPNNLPSGATTPSPNENNNNLQGMLNPTPGAILPPIRSTTDPTNDSRPPTTSMSPLPAVSPVTFTVSWSGDDDSGIEKYLVWVQINGGEWQPWLETERIEAVYTGVVGSTYNFAVWAVDLAGNWSTNTTLTPQATTQVEG